MGLGDFFRSLSTPPAATLSGALVTPEWLQANLTGVNLLDATFVLPNSGRDPVAEYTARHIAGARFFSIEAIADKSTALPHMLPSEAEFATAMRQLGIDERKPIIVYDDGSALGACRCWWMLRVFGFDKIALLDGGLPAWQAAGYAVTDAVEPARNGRFTARFRPELVWNREQVLDNLKTGDVLLLDARPAPRFKGEQAEPRPGLQRGHIPGSLNLPSATLLDANSKRFKSPAELQILLADAGVRQDEPIVTTCGSGVSACVIAFALALLGRDAIPVYDGSWAEWGSTAGCPVMLGPPQRLAALPDDAH